ncbi:hypothetical protein FRC17_000736 [Serendipita sp. 399]|nr:hypothetical protein FRC17_000736 [Serendipita sp. 399]
MQHHIIYVVLLATSLLGQFQPVSAARSCSCKAEKEAAVKNFQFRVSYTPTTTESVILSAWSAGGGDRRKIPSSTSSFTLPFAGREYGGGTRKQIYGTRAYGSGYPYGGFAATSIAGRPFPLVVWPISWGAGYLGGEEYHDGPSADFIRPGGPLGVTKVGTTNVSTWPRVNTTEEVYEIIGDKESMTFVMAQLVDRCKATPQWPTAFFLSSSANNGTTTTMSTSTRPEMVLQYYRASSFALAFPGYNNTFALPSSNPRTTHDWADSSPLPTNISRSSFLRCINSTIGDALPIIQPPKSPKKGLSSGELVGVIFSAIIGFFVVWAIMHRLWTCCKTWINSRNRKPVPEDEAEVELVGTERIDDDGRTEVDQEDVGRTGESGKAGEKSQENVVYV